jgi:hypothetical protein
MGADSLEAEVSGGQREGSYRNGFPRGIEEVVFLFFSF